VCLRKEQQRWERRRAGIRMRVQMMLLESLGTDEVGSPKDKLVEEVAERAGTTGTQHQRIDCLSRSNGRDFTGRVLLVVEDLCTGLKVTHSSLRPSRPCSGSQHKFRLSYER